MKFQLCTVLCFLTIYFGPVELSDSDLRCLDERGFPLDWFVAIKVPKKENLVKPYKDGLGYVYVTSRSYKGWKTSGNAIDSQSSLIRRTIEQVTKQLPSVQYLQYNDANEVNDNGNNGHMKGVFASDGKRSFWLIHSVPHFPQILTKEYKYPDSGRVNGQHLICLSFNSEKEITKILNQLLIMQPTIYGHNFNDTFKKKFSQINDLLNKKWDKTEYPKSKKVTLITSGNRQFVHFAKSPKHNVDLWKEISEDYRTDFNVQSWQNGAGGKLESDCKSKYKLQNVETIQLKEGNCEYVYPADNVKDANIRTKSKPRRRRSTENSRKKTKKCSVNPISYESAKDHSKMAVSDRSSHAVCFGDINRMKSQEKRGGGSVCFENTELWKTMKNSFVPEPCEFKPKEKSESSKHEKQTNNSSSDKENKKDKQGDKGENKNKNQSKDNKKDTNKK